MEKQIAKVLARKEFAAKNILLWILTVILTIVLVVSIINKDISSITISIMNLVVMIIIFFLLHRERGKRITELEHKIRS